MIEQTGNAITFKVLYIASKAGKTGLTVTVDVYRNGTLIVDDAAVTEQGGGIYSYTLASGSVNAEGYYEALFNTADSTVDAKTIGDRFFIGKAGIEHLDANVSTAAAGADPMLNQVPGDYDQGTAGNAIGRLLAGPVDIFGPVIAADQVELVIGDDYSNTDSRALEWTSDGWPDLTGATIGFVVSIDEARVLLSAPGSVVTPTATAKVRVPLTAAQTNQLSSGRRRFKLVATKSDRMITLAHGVAKVVDQ